MEAGKIFCAIFIVFFQGFWWYNIAIEVAHQEEHMAEKNIELDSVEIAAAVFGNCDRNIRLLENEFSVTAVCRGTQLRLSGEPANVAAASRAVEGMLLLIENHTPLEDLTALRNGCGN
jgi:phosphate starvation-inducible protein PhoH